MRSKPTPALLLAALAVLPAVLLAAPASADAAAAGCPGTYVTLDATATGGGIHYVGDDGSLWKETNRLKGLQCDRLFLDGRAYDADTRILV